MSSIVTKTKVVAVLDFANALFLFGKGEARGVQAIP